MNYKGIYSNEGDYSVGDVVVYEDDGVAYVKTKLSGEGVTPHDKLHWEQLKRPLQDVVIMFHGCLVGMKESMQTIAARVPSNISDEAIVLTASDENDYIITVDASGDTPELAVTLVEPEEDAEGGDDT